jgi:hypothetical protein
MGARLIARFGSTFSEITPHGVTTWAIAFGLAAFSDPVMVACLESRLLSPGLHRVQVEPGPVAGSRLARGPTWIL